MHRSVQLQATTLAIFLAWAPAGFLQGEEDGRFETAEQNRLRSPENIRPLRENPDVAQDTEGEDWQYTRLLGPLVHGRGGLAAEYVYTGEVFTNMRGGINTNRATEYRGNLDLILSAELDEMRLFPGGTVFLYAQNGHGRGVTADHVGDYQVLSNIDAPDLMQVSEYWWDRVLLDGFLQIRLGKQDCNRDFAAVELAADFVNSSFGFHPTIPMPTFPDPSMAAVGLFQFTDSLSFEAGVWDGAPDGGNWGFSGTGETFSIYEFEVSYGLGPQRQLPGDFHIGIWYHSARWDDLALGPTAARAGNYGAHVEMEQAILKRPGGESEGHQGLGTFVQYGWAPPDRNEAHQYLGGGLVLRGASGSRPEDVIGLGVAHLIFSDRLPDQTSETAIELFYKAPLAPWAVMQPDLQYIAQPGGTGRDAFVFGLRFELAL